MGAVEDSKEGVFPVAYIVNLYVNTGERRFDGTDAGRRWPALARACVAKLCTLDNPGICMPRILIRFDNNKSFASDSTENRGSPVIISPSRMTESANTKHTRIELARETIYVVQGGFWFSY